MVKKIKQNKIKKFAYGGTTFSQESPQEALERFHKDALIASYEADKAAAPYEFASKLAFQLGSQMLGASIGNAGGFGKILGKNGEISGFGKGLDSIFGFETGPTSFGKFKEIPGAVVEKISSSNREDNDYSDIFGKINEFNSLKGLRGKTGIFATGGVVKHMPIEAEGGEVVETPNGNISELFGPSHENGGMPMDVPTGTTIYSDRVRGEDGKTMAERKKQRELAEEKILRKLKKNPSDKILLNTLKRIQANNQLLDNKDTEQMEQINELMNFERNNLQKFAYGGFINPPNENQRDIEELFLTKKRSKPLGSVYVNNTLGTIPYKNNFDELLDKVNNTKVIHSLVENKTNSSIPSKFDWNKIFDTAKGVINSSGVKDLTAGDIYGMYSQIKGANKLIDNTLREYETTPQEVNFYKDYGKKALNKIRDQYGVIEALRDSALREANLSRNSQINQNNSSTRGLNTLRALNLAVDAQQDNLMSEIFDKSLQQKLGVMGQEAQQLNDIDLKEMSGEEQRADRELRNKAAFFSNMAKNIANKTKAQTQIADMFNKAKERGLMEKLYEKAYPNFNMYKGANYNVFGDKTVESDNTLSKLNKAFGLNSDKITPELVGILNNPEKLKQVNQLLGTLKTLGI